ncbi:MAG: cation transporter [Candidatus Altiarchaeales archaeon ex4484_2]|nr:MAG: cation transporter [Candidatus Altiarchaeales archaeon ex4484_2]
MSSRNRKSDFREFILMCLLKLEPLSYEQLWRKFMQMTSSLVLGSQYFEEWGERFGDKVEEFITSLGFKAREKPRRRRKIRKRKEGMVEEDFQRDIRELIREGLIQEAGGGKYQLTDEGRLKAEEHKNNMEKGAHVFRTQIVSPTAAARNTIIVDFILAVLKLTAGFISGSIALIADGADAAADTFSALIVWVGMKVGKDHIGALVIILMMFLTGASIGFESLTKLAEALTAGIEPMKQPYLVIVVESVALIAAVILMVYQRYVGKHHGSLTLISQSIDSRNHIYVALAVITGAGFSLLGVCFIDALIGAYIAVKILQDAFELLQGALSSMQGEETDFSKYNIPLEGHYHGYRIESFRNWILYTMREDGLKTREELIKSLEEVYRPEYVPILSEFSFSLGEGFDFRKEFDELVKPLTEKKYISRRGEEYALTREGGERIHRVLENLKFHTNK